MGGLDTSLKTGKKRPLTNYSGFHQCSLKTSDQKESTAVPLFNRKYSHVASLVGFPHSETLAIKTWALTPKVSVSSSPCEETYR